MVRLPIHPYQYEVITRKWDGKIIIRRKSPPPLNKLSPPPKEYRSLNEAEIVNKLISWLRGENPKDEIFPRKRGIRIKPRIRGGLPDVEYFHPDIDVLQVKKKDGLTIGYEVKFPIKKIRKKEEYSEFELKKSEKKDKFFGY